MEKKRDVKQKICHSDWTNRLWCSLQQGTNQHLWWRGLHTSQHFGTFPCWECIALYQSDTACLWRNRTAPMTTWRESLVLASSWLCTTWWSTCHTSHTSGRFCTLQLKNKQIAFSKHRELTTAPKSHQIKLYSFMSSYFHRLKKSFSNCECNRIWTR